MAARKKSKQRLRGVLRVYQREMRGGALWWWCALGRARHALDLDASVTRDEAYRIACERFGSGQLPRAHARGEGSEGTLAEILIVYTREQASHYKPRTWASKEFLLNAFAKWIAAHKVERPSQITDALLAQWIAERQKGVGKKKGSENAPLNRALDAARVCLRWASKREPPLCKPTALERVKDLREIGRTQHNIIPSPDEWKHIVASLASEPPPKRCGNGQLLRERHQVNARGAALLVACGVETGLRIDELRHIRPIDVDDTAAQVKAFEGWAPKSWEERTVPITRETAKTLRAFIQWRDVARGLNGRKIVLGDHWINDRLDEVWRRGNLPDDAARMHDCRRTFATAQVRAGVGIDRVRVLLGHKDVSTTERYIGRYRSDADEPVTALGVAAVLDAPVADVIPMPAAAQRRRR